MKFANTTTSVRFNGGIVRLTEDDAWIDDDPFVKARPDMFSDRPRNLFSSAGRVEQATAAPGERRNVKRG